MEMMRLYLEQKGGLCCPQRRSFLSEPVEQFSIVCDCYGISKENLDLGLVKALFKTLSAHYPERLHTIYVVHANRRFHKAFGVIKKMLAAKTASKFRVMKEVDELKEFFDDEGLLIEHNGSSNAHEEFCEKLNLEPLASIESALALEEETEPDNEPESKSESEVSTPDTEPTK
eukprot:TRINITY_DN312_c0_g1_i5.p1 TRINITY_DN312_c0_g1~~TRINITY_DN312_c0_g1_i5.p1  ORF type:complete len:173 (-),score=56.12 TRINITY_DN312_c0_g1_i5:158-676(-)